MSIVIRNKSYKDPRTMSLDVVKDELKVYAANNNDKEFFETSEILNNCPGIKALQPLTDGEIHMLCINAGLEFTREK